MTRPNVLFIVWDACRLDTAQEHAPTLASLAEENLWFETAVSPAGSSLPSHVSMTRGTYPHKHGVYKQSHTIEKVPLVSELSAEGYRTFGVSANGFASSKYRFDVPFDEFFNTQGVVVSPDGLDIHRYARVANEESDDGFSPGSIDKLDLVRKTLRHDNPVASILNVAAGALSEVVSSYPILQRIPHPRFNQYNEFNYSPKQNTDRIIDLFERSATQQDPFFVFTNYMDPHHPYAPPSEHQRKLCGETFSYRELARLNRVSHPWNYLSRVESGEQLDKKQLATLRNLYAGEVKRADDHLKTLLGALEEQGLRDETLIVVTADHGENLGETNGLGERHMGHVCSSSDNHLQVPLLIAHPDLDSRIITEPVSLKDIYHLLTTDRNNLIASAGRELGRLTAPDRVVTSQVPATANEALLERHPALADYLQRHIVVGYDDDWKVVVTSDGTEHARYGDETRSVERAPDALVEHCREQVKELVETENSGRELTDAEISHLESLGYI
jgi:arylsulfatase A-like enzyme